MNMKHFVLFLSFAALTMAQAPPADSSVVVGTVNGKNITFADIQRMLASGEPGFAEAYQQNPSDAVSKFLFMQFLSEEADRRKLTENALIKQQLEADRQKILRQGVLEQERNNYAVSTAELEAYYNAHKAQYQQAVIKAIYIPFKTNTPIQGTSVEAMKAAAQAALGIGQPKRTEAEALTLAQEVVKKLREGMDFAKAVELYSEDATSKAAGGYYGVLKANSPYTVEFRKMVLALKPAEISEPLRQPGGYYIFRGEEKLAESLGEAASEIMDAIRDNHWNEWMKQKTDSFQFVVKDPQALQNATAPGAPPPLLVAPKSK